MERLPLASAPWLQPRYVTAASAALTSACIAVAGVQWAPVAGWSARVVAGLGALVAAIVGAMVASIFAKWRGDSVWIRRGGLLALLGTVSTLGMWTMAICGTELTPRGKIDLFMPTTPGSLLPWRAMMAVLAFGGALAVGSVRVHEEEDALDGTDRALIRAAVAAAMAGGMLAWQLHTVRDLFPGGDFGAWAGGVATFDLFGAAIGVAGVLLALRGAVQAWRLQRWLARVESGAEKSWALEPSGSETSLRPLLAGTSAGRALVRRTASLAAPPFRDAGALVQRVASLPGEAATRVAARRKVIAYTAATIVTAAALAALVLCRPFHPSIARHLPGHDFPPVAL